MNNNLGTFAYEGKFQPRVLRNLAIRNPDSTFIISDNVVALSYDYNPSDNSRLDEVISTFEESDSVVIRRRD